MRVAFDSRATRGHHGIARYSRELLAALREQHGDQIVESVRPRAGEVFHSPWIDGAPLRPPVPVVVTLHDLIPLRRRAEYLRTGVRFRLRYLAVRRATRVIVPTQTVAEDARRLLELPDERLVVIPEAAASAFRPRSAEEVREVRRRLGLPEEYLLWVGSLRTRDPRKRVTELAAAPRRLPLVLCGEKAPWTRTLRDVTLTGYVDDDDLAAVYTGARALVFPSDDEGFGLPPVEALACGTPVVAADSRALREVLDGRAEFVAPADLEGLLAQAERARRPPAPSSGWSWSEAATATWEVYEEALAAAPGT